MRSRGDNSIDIDIGGTFTDCFVRFQGNQASAKSPTTPFDLSVGFMRAIIDVARQLRIRPELLISQIYVIRYSTTLAMNKLLERTGQKLGLITTEGFEDTILIGTGAQWDDGISRDDARNLALVSKPGPLIPRERIVGVKERIGSKGEIMRPLSEGDVRRKLQILVNQGVRGIVVSLIWSHVNPLHEIKVREIIEEGYPEACLGYFPVVLSHEVQPKKGEYRRTMTAVLSAYLKDSAAEDLGNIRRELRDAGYMGLILMVHNSGGMAELLKTTAIDTYNGGHISGIIGSMEIGKLYDYENVITTDMGGTSFDMGVIQGGKSHYSDFRPVVDRWMVNIRMIECKTIGAGGGSVAWINETLGGKLEVGPHSAGSMPGPACYNLGGSQPTVTDADVVLGYINPDFFHGGRIRLDRDLAFKAIYEKVARPLQIDVEEAAARIRMLIDGAMGNSIFQETALRGYDPREFIIFSFGGAGPTHCCDYAQFSYISRVIAFPFSPVFCAFSGALMDIRHHYELSRRVIVINPGENEPILDPAVFNEIVTRLIEKGVATAKSEGLQPEKLLFNLELDMKYTRQLHVRRVKSPRLTLRDKRDVLELLQAFTDEYGKAFGSAGIYPQGGVSIESFVLNAIYPMRRPEFPQSPLSKPNPPSSARKGWRMVYWREKNEFSRTPLYDHDRLRCGNTIDGPAIIEARDTTFVVPPWARFHIDKYMNNIMERQD